MTVANNVLKHGTGGLNIDGTRIKTSDSLDGGGTIDKSNYETVTLPSVPVRGITGEDTGGRFPANLIHDGSDEVEAVFPQTGKSRDGGRSTGVNFGGNGTKDRLRTGHDDNGGSASRFFYKSQLTQEELCENKSLGYLTRSTYVASQQEPVPFAAIKTVDSQHYSLAQSTEHQSSAQSVISNTKEHGARLYYCPKASKSERNAGLEGFEGKSGATAYTGEGGGVMLTGSGNERSTLRANHHPTVKPLSLTKYLATLIKPPTGGRLLVPFSGSGSEMIGALQAGWEYVEGVELTEEYIPIAEARIKYWLEKKEPENQQVALDV
jgi:site-specific DNA-methyltransferase (adenine-specific)